MPIPAILMGLAQLAPAIIGLLDSDDSSTANKAAQAVSEVARAVTGTNDDERALAALKSNPEMLLRYQEGVTARAVSLYQEETKRLEAVNQTMRAEVASSDPYVRRMRPTFGYIMALTWGCLMLAVGYTIVTEPSQAAAVVNAVASLSGLWVPGLAVLGVYVYKRSEEKKPDAGGMSVLGAIAKRIAG